MKSFFLFAALLLSSSGVWAEGYLHLNCEVEVTNTKTDLLTKKILEQNVKSGSIVFKVDLENQRSMGAGSGTWEDIQIVDGVIRDVRTGEIDGFKFEAKRAVWIQPPGKFTVNTVALNDTISVAIDTDGECSEIDALVFDEAR